jgi:DnaJ-class molecular chaperone
MLPYGRTREGRLFSHFDSTAFIHLFCLLTGGGQSFDAGSNPKFMQQRRKKLRISLPVRVEDALVGTWKGEGPRREREKLEKLGQGLPPVSKSTKTPWS